MKIKYNNILLEEPNFTLFLADVGDGLCVGLSSKDDMLQIDCGGSRDKVLSGIENYCEKQNKKPNTFLLSHLHTDHYSGLLKATDELKMSSTHFSEIRKVYYPPFPKFKEVENYACCYLALQSVRFGFETGVAESDFLSNIEALVGSHLIEDVQLVRGMSINICGLEMNILWPPDKIPFDIIGAKVRRAISSFEKIANKVPKLKELRDMYQTDADRYIYDNKDNYKTTKCSGSDSTKRSRKRTEIIEVLKTHPEVVPDVNRANKDFLSAQNDLSIAFIHKNHSLLFLGDLSDRCIGMAMDGVGHHPDKKVGTIVAAHHGTHWHRSLEKWPSYVTVASNGEKMIKTMKDDYKKNTQQFLCTYCNGHITTEFTGIPVPGGIVISLGTFL